MRARYAISFRENIYGRSKQAYAVTDIRAKRDPHLRHITEYTEMFMPQLP